MNQFKIYRKDNYIIVVNDFNGELYQGFVKEVFVKKSNTNQAAYKLFNVKDFDYKNGLIIEQILKEDGNPYTQSEFEDFYTQNTGNFNGGGDSQGIQSVTGDIVDNTDPENPVVNKPIIYQTKWLTDMQGLPTNPGRYWNGKGEALDDPLFTSTMPTGTAPWQVFDWDGSTATVVHNLVVGDRVLDFVTNKVFLIQLDATTLDDLGYVQDASPVGIFPNWESNRGYFKGELVTDTYDNNIYVCKRGVAAATFDRPSNDIYTNSGDPDYIETGHWVRLRDVTGGVTLDNFLTVLETTRTKGIQTLILDGITTVYTIAHGLGQIPSVAFAVRKSSTNFENYNTDWDDTNIILTYATPPAAESLDITWIALK